MKKVILTLLALILVHALAMAQYTGGNGKGDISGAISGSPLGGIAVYVSASSATPGPTPYDNLKAAFDAINAGTHQGTVTVTITSSTTESATAVLYASGGFGKTPAGGGSSYTSVYIYPTATGLSISGNLAGPLIDLDGADNVTMDGRVNGSTCTVCTADLTISNTSTSTTTGTSTIRFINDASGNSVKYCTLKGSTTDGSAGIVFFSSTSGSTGNDNNLIDHNNLTNSADENRPVNAVYSLGSVGNDNSNNAISNNNIYNFLSRGLASQGIFLSSNTTSCTISGNSFYETATFVPTAGVNYVAIRIDNEGTNFNVSGNYIGGSSPACIGTWIKTNLNWNDFYAILLNVGNGSASNIQGNAIQNFSWSNSAGQHYWCGILGVGNLNIGTLEGNTIGGSTGTGSITYTAESVEYGSFHGIGLMGTGPMDIQNNIIGSITVAGSNDATGIDFTGIYSLNSGTTTITNNTIGSATTANSINLISPSTTWPQQAFGILNWGTGTVTISGNIIANMKNGTTNSSAAIHGCIHGIKTFDGSNNISNNTIRDLTIANANSNAFDEVSAAGIMLTVTSAAPQSITGNTIYNLSNTNTSFTGGVIGLFYQGSTTTSTVSNNFIHSLSMTNPTTAANIYGIKIYNGTTTWSNNIISVGSNSNANIYGIYERGDAGNNNSLYHNTVYISGAVNSGTPKSYALYNATSTNTRDFRNNIFNNQRFDNGAKSPSNGSLYSNFAAYFASTGGVLTCDYNDYYINNASYSGATLGFYGGDKTGLPIVTGVTGNDASSQAINPLFAIPGGTTATSYIPSASTLTGVPGTGITTDYAGVVRNISYPAMGAWEYNVTPYVTVSASAGTLTGGYWTLKEAFDRINDGTHQGTVTVTINANTTESASAVLNASLGPILAPGNGGAHYSSVYVYPTTSGLSVTGDLAAPLIDLNGADNVTFDGRVGGSTCTICTADLTISNTSTSSTDGTCTVRFINDASSNTINYCTVKGSTTTPTTGIIFFSTTTGSTGNDHNTIDHNNITNSADANRPVISVFSLGTASKENGDITISNNNIYNFLNRGLESHGIYLSSNTTSCTISGNSFYETASFVAMAEVNYLAIRIENGGTNFNVSGNYIGGSSPACSGTWIKTNANWDDFYAIVMNVGYGTASNIQGNTINNFSWSNSLGKHTWCGIWGAGNLNIGTLESNTIGGSTGTGSITYTAESDVNGWFIGIGVVGPGPIDIQNNIVGSITVAGSNNATGIDFTGIANLTTGSATISNNTIGSNTTANSINLISPSTTWAQKASGILNMGTGTVTISGNLIANMTNGSTNSNPGTRGCINGILTMDGSNTISDNIIRDLTIANANNHAFDEVSAAGIVVTVTTAAVQSITGNTIYNISNFGSYGSVNVTGLYYNGSTTSSTISGNFIHGLSIGSPSGKSPATAMAGSIYGIKMNAGYATYENNIINLGTNTPTTIYGIYESGDAGTINNLYFNTVYITGAPLTGSDPSYALYSATSTSTRIIKNNIFDNQRYFEIQKSPALGPIKHYAVYFASTGGALTCDYNDYYVSGTGGGTLGYYGADKTGLPIVTGVTGNDAHSQAIDPLFASAGSASPTGYLPSAPTLAGTPGTGILSDYGGNTRSLVYPAMGAWEYPVSPPCVNPTSGGTIAAAQTGCNPFSPETISSVTTPTGHTGTLEYKWQYSVTSSSAGFTDLSIGTYTATTYTPGTLSVTTWYKRLSKVTCEGTWTITGESNVVTITVNPNGQVDQPGSQLLCNGSTTQSVIFTTQNTGGTTTYAWTNSNTSIGLAASGTGNITAFTAINTGTEPVTATIAVTPTYSSGGTDCPGSIKTFTFTVNPTGQVNQPQNQLLCTGSTTSAVTFTTVNTGGTTTYSWTNTEPGIGLAASGTGDIASFTAINLGTVPVYATIVVTPTFTYSEPDKSLSGQGFMPDYDTPPVGCIGATKTFTIKVSPTGQVDQPLNQIICHNASTAAVNFTTVNTGGTTTYAWVNSTPGIGLAASGTGNIPAFTAINTGTEPVTATIVVTPTFSMGLFDQIMTIFGVNCEGEAKIFSITVNPILPVSVSVTPNPNPSCATWQVTFTAIPVNGGLAPTYQWNVNGTNTGDNNPSFSYFASNNDAVYCLMTSSETCPGGSPATSNTVTMTVKPLLPVSVTVVPSETAVCSGTPVTYTAFPVNGGDIPIYSWQVNGFAAGTNNPVFTYAPLAGDVIICMLTSYEQCAIGNPAMSNQVAVTVHPLPVPTITGIGSVCEGTTGVTYTTQPSMTGYTWTVSGGVIISGQGTSTITVNWMEAGSHTVTVNYTNANGCTALMPTVRTVMVNPLPVPLISGPDAVCVGTTGVTYSTESGMTGYTWIISPGGTKTAGGTSSSGFITVTWHTAGDQWVSVNYTNSNGCTAATSTIKEVMVKPYLPVSVMIAPSVNPSCMNNLVHVTATPVNGGQGPSYQWFVNGYDYGVNSPDFFYVPANNDVISCILTSNEMCTKGNPATSNTVTMTVNPLLAVDITITASVNPSCAGSPVTFTANPVNGGNQPSYQWKVNGVSIGTNQPVFSYLPVTGDVVTCVLTSSEQCTTGNPVVSNAITMTVKPVLPVSVSIVSSFNGLCSGTPVTFTATPVNGGNAPVYQWIVNGISQGAGLSTFTYVPSNNDVVTCLLTSSELCTQGNPATSNTITMTVNPNLPVSVTITASANPVCPNTPVTFMAFGVNGGNNPRYQWKVNGVNAGSNSSLFFHTPSEGEMISCVFYSNEICTGGNPATSNIITMAVTPVVAVSVSIAASANPVTAGTPAIFTATPVNPGTNPAFEWKVNGITTGPNGPVYSYTPVNNDEVTAIMTSSRQCVTGNPAVSNAITMIVTTPVPATVTVTGIVGPGEIICYNAMQTITVAGSGTTFLVQEGGSATFIAGQNILYLPGTTVQQGGFMRGYIAPTGPWCGTLAPSIPAIIAGDNEVVPVSDLVFFRVYPNPTYGTFILEYLGKDNPGKIKVEIYGMKGDKILSKELVREYRHEFSLAERPTGIYMIRITTSGSTKMLRILKR